MANFKKFKLKLQEQLIMGLVMRFNYAIQRESHGGTIRQVAFNNTTSDYLFIYTANEKIYLIPTKDITAINAITVGIKYTEYEVQIKSFADFIDEL